MAFLQCHSDFSPLFRLLDNYNHETHAGPKATTHSVKSRPVRRATFTPSFDVREGSDGYFLDGELPGIDQSNIEIEFSDPQTLIVKGRTERNYQLAQPQAQVEASQQAETQSSPSSPSLHATVEDDDEDYDAIHSDAGSTDSKRQREEQLVQPEPEPQAQAQAAESEADDFHFWASERSIGEFQRTFAFSARVDQDGVRASLKNGILSIYVPKLALPKTKKIRIL